MKKKLLIIILVTVNCKSFCRDPYIDSMVHELSIATADSSRLEIMADLASSFLQKNLDSTLYYGYKALNLSQRLGYKNKETGLFFLLSLAYGDIGNTEKAVEMDLKGLDIAKQLNEIHLQADIFNRLGEYYLEAKDYDQSLQYIRTSYNLFESEGERSAVFAALSLNLIADVNLEKAQLDSAEYYNNEASKKWNDVSVHDPGNASFIDNQFIKSQILYTHAGIEKQKGNYTAAIQYLKESLANNVNNFYADLIKSNCELARVFLKINRVDSAIVYARRAFSLADSISQYKGVAEAGNLLAEIFKQKDPQQAILYQQQVIAAYDSAVMHTKASAITNMVDFDEQQRRFETETATQAYQNKVRLYILFTGLGVVVLIAFILYRNNRQKQKANAILQQQKEEINIQKDKAERTLVELKSAQTQLIQQEKMASLGELTAGIAHEIQNPLNFVNNFSEVSNELIDEMNEELDKGDIEEAKAIATDIQQNLEKINHHGKRADAIVKGMLQHSRTSSGQKEPTDINALCDEYLRLSYHGLRAKDKTFNAEIKTDFDESIGRINIVPQDIGRVLLNLINNAFYAINEKRKKNNAQYEPTVILITKKVGDQISISVKDNGNGIPDAIKEKIFQPFFTTKPTGQGTGLGLSLSYDIIKAHGGEITLETKEGEGTEFIIMLPA